MSETTECAWGIPPEGFRLPAATRPGSVVLQVAQLEVSLAWYREVLGLVVLRRSGNEADLGVESDAGALVTLVELDGAAPVPRNGRLGLYHFAILLPERSHLGPLLRHLTHRGLHPGASDHLVSEALYLHDPDGLGVEVYADRPRGSWSHRDGQLLMATDPLDIEEVLRAGSPDPWAGMPPGTTIGHLHLHVGDLDAARTFYHVGLGLDVVVWSYPGALFLSAGGYHHHLGVNTWARAARRPGPGDARLLEWTLLLPSAEDVASALESLDGIGRGALPSVGTGEGIPRVADPWGTVLRLQVDGA